MAAQSNNHTSRIRDVGLSIAKRRMATGLTQEYVAEQLGIGVEAVSRIERGVVQPTISRLLELADIFKCNVADLLTESSPRVTDQASRLEQLLEPLNNADRTLVLDIIEKMTQRLRKG